MIEQILLDMDGILSDFNTAALSVHGALGLAETWPPGRWDMEGVMGISKAEFWKPVDTYDFWRNLVLPYEQALGFYTALKGFCAVTICTSPSQSAECARAKVEWLREYIDPDVKYMIGSQKWLMGNPNHLLVDDYDQNVGKFREHGGIAVLFPRVWNSDWRIAAECRSSVYARVLGRVESLIG